MTTPACCHLMWFIRSVQKCVCDLPLGLDSRLRRLHESSQCTMFTGFVFLFVNYSTTTHVPAEMSRRHIANSLNYRHEILDQQHFILCTMRYWLLIITIIKIKIKNSTTHRSVTFKATWQAHPLFVEFPQNSLPISHEVLMPHSPSLASVTCICAVIHERSVN